MFFNDAGDQVEQQENQGGMDELDSFVQAYEAWDARRHAAKGEPGGRVVKKDRFVTSSPS